MNPYPSMEQAQKAAEVRLARAADARDSPCAEWLAETMGQPTSARGATFESETFWRTLMAAGDPRPVLLHASDLYMADGRPGWSRALIFLAGLSGVSSELQERLRDAEQAEEDANQVIDEGIALHDAGRFEDAIAVYDQIIARHPGSAWARHEKAFSLATLGDEANDAAVQTLCREAQTRDPFYAKAWTIPEQAQVFASAIAPTVYGTARDRMGYKRLAHGLQALDLPGLAAITWYQLMHEEPQDSEILGPLAECLDTLGVEQALNFLDLPAPVSAGRPGADTELRRTVASFRELVEREYLDGHPDLARASLLLRMATRLGEDDLEVALAHNLLGAILKGQSLLHQAESHLRQALTILETKALPDDPNLVITLQNLAAILIDQDRFPEARQYLSRGLDVVEDPSIHAILLGSLARVELDLGDLAEAEQLAQQASAKAEDAPQPDEMQVWELLGLRADIARAGGEHSQATEILEELLRLQTEALAADDRRLAVTQNNLATACEALGSLDRAEALLRESLSVRRRALGESHPYVATAENNLALLLARQQRLQEAHSHMSSALELRRRGLSKDDPVIPVTLVNLAEIETALGFHDKALEHLAEALELDTQLLDRLSRGRTPYESAFLRAQVGQRMGVLLWTALTHEASPKAQQLAAECILVRKGAPERAAVPRSPDYQAAVRALASLLLGGPRSRSPLDYRVTLDLAQERIDQLEQLEPTQEAPRSAEELLTSVRSALGDRVLLEYVRVEPPGGPGHEGEVARYTVLVLGASVEQVLWLGPCERVDRLVRRYRETMDEAPAWVTGNERAAEASLRLIAQALYRELVEPIRDLLGTATRVIVAPDHQLHLVPFGVLVGPDGRYLIEDLELATVESGHYVLRKALPPAPGGDVCVFVDPDFELEPEHPVQEPKFHLSRVAQYLSDARWTRLEGTREEASAIVEALPGETVRVFSDREATEASLFDLHSPRILHVSTHGFFLRADELPPLPPAEERPFEIGVPAMLCSGLALAGAGTLARHPASGVSDKGLVTALEVATLDLQGTELVVLSGCETAVGAPLPGEGVLGLRRAFQQAGAEQLVSSLWKVPEVESATLLHHVYRHIGDGDDPVAALRYACLEVLEERRTAFRAAHPLFWGGFIAIGSPQRLPGVGTQLPQEDGERLVLPLQDDVQVVATAHTLEAGGPLPVATLVTQGLERIGAPELALTVLRESPPSTGRLLGLLGSALAAARSDHPPAVGELLPIQGGPLGLLGLGRFERGLVWHPNALAAVPETSSALTVQLLTAEEASHVDDIGPLRLMARRGHAAAFYPTAPWVDPERKPLIDDGELESSLVAHVRSLRLPNARISRIARAGLWGLSIEVGRESAPHLVEQLDRRDDLVGWSLLGYEDPEADAIMVWHAGAPPTAIVPGPPHASRFALNFVIVVREEEDRLDWVEDGAIWALSQETWSRLTEAIRNGDGLLTKVGESPVRWAWLSPAKPESTVQLEAVQLLTSNEQALKAVTSGEAAGLIERTERALIEVARELTHEPLKLLVRLALQPDGGLRVQYQSTDPDGEDLYRAMTDALGRQYWPMLPGDEIEIAMQFSLLGSAEGLPNPPHNLSTAPQGNPAMTEKETPAGPFADYVRVRMTIWSEVDTLILIDGEYVTDVDHTTGFDYASASITISPSSQITFKAASFEITRSVIRFVDPQERTLEARIGTNRNCEVVISEEQKLAAMGTPEDIPRLTADLLTNTKSSVRYTAAQRLGYIGDRAAVPALLEALDSDVDPYVLACVATALGRIGDTSVIPALERAFENYDRKESYGYIFEAALRDLAFLRNRENRDSGA